jgi:DNA replication ATP-dependent helicase Dna2
MPGTGKTRTICIMIDLMIKMNMRVLITSFTHVALDNIIDKFIEMFPNQKNRMVRMKSSKQDASQRIKDITFKRDQLQNFENIEEFFVKKPVFFTTCLSVSDPLLQSKMFDYVLVDETSQVVEVKLLKCLSLAKKFVLIGDYLQLCPLVSSEKAQLRGMSISLLERLARQHPDWVVDLTIQVSLDPTFVVIFNLFLVQNEQEHHEFVKQLDLQEQAQVQ